MKLGKTLAALTALVAISTTAIAAPATTQKTIDKNEATAIALQLMPRGTEHISTDYDKKDKEYEVKFNNGGTKEKYEVNVDAVLGTVEELESETYLGFDKNAPNRVKNKDYSPKYSKAQIIDLVKKAYAGAVVTEIELEKDGGYWIYEVEFASDRILGSLELDPETGRTLERDLEFRVVGTDIPTTLPSDEVVEGVFTETQAIEKIYNQLPKGTNFVKSERHIEDNRVSYEVTFTYKTYHIEAVVDGSTGRVEEVDVFCTADVDKDALNHYENGRYVARYSPDKIEAIVLKEFPTATVTSIEMGLSRDMWVYDVDMRLENGDVDVLVCPETGNILAIDMDINQADLPVHPVLPPVDPDVDMPLIPLEPSKPVEPEEDRLLTEEEVRTIIKKLVPKGVITEIELDEDDDEWVYEVEVEDKKHEYEIEIDAETGKTLEFEKEKLDDDDDDDYDYDDDDDDDDDDDERDDD